MKKFILTFCLFVTTLTGFAAEINFLDNPVWSTVLAKAKQEKKMIFLDAYAVWCGPCKNMDAVTYKDQAVADFYNTNFINVKYDMEKGEGRTLASNFQVTAYPSLLFIDADGLLLHKGLGFIGAANFVTLGKEAKNPSSQYYTLKKNALNLSSTDFAKFSEQAAGFQDEEFDALAKSYLAKQPDILGNEGLIDLVMQSASSLPNEQALAYFAKSKAKITASKKYNDEAFDDRLINFALMYAISDAVQVNPNDYDFEAVKKVLDQYVPAKSFFLLNYFKIRHYLTQEKLDEAIAVFDVLLSNTPAKVTIDQACNTMVTIGPALLAADKLAPTLKKFDAIVVPAKDADRAYMKDFVKAIIYIKGKQLDEFKGIANTMLASPTVPASVKTDLRATLSELQ